MTTWAEAAQQHIEVVGQLASLTGELQAWTTGDADGGPLGDGRYPFTQPDGTVVLVACIAAITAMGLTAEGVAALTEAVEADVGAGFKVLGVAEDGEVKRFAPHMIPARTTAQVDQLHSEEYAEWLLCLASGSGKERRVAAEALRQSVGNVIDPTHPPYNVRYDFQKTKPVKTVTGSNLIETVEAVFTGDDLGKQVAVSNADSDGALRGWIGEVLDSRRIRIFTNLSFTTPKNATSSQLYGEMIWGTDSTAGLQQAFDDAEALGPYPSLGKVVIIGGIALATELRFGSISIIGLGQTGCGFAALPYAGRQQPFFADKNTGRYATLKPDAYTIRNISILGQRYTQHYSSFRNAFEIRGGLFNAFVRGAPYAVVDGLDVSEAQWNGIVTNGAFAGLFNNARAYQCAQIGMRMGLWDLNGTNWHAEGNGCTGLLSVMPGANVNVIRLSYNGSDGGRTLIAGGYFPHEYGANFTECGGNNNYSGMRTQESWGHNVCFSSKDPLNVSNNGGGKCSVSFSTFDDTGNIAPGKGLNTTRLPGVRAMVYVKGATAINNTVDFVTGSGHVQITNYATNAYGDEGNPSGNEITIRTPGISNDPAAWYSGTGPLAATSRGPWMTSSDSSIAARGNIVTINRQVAP